MKYDLIFLPEAQQQIARLSPDDARRVLAKLEHMRNDLAGDVKRLTNVIPAYRLRVGDWRVLFEVVGSAIVIYRIRHRSVAYD